MWAVGGEGGEGGEAVRASWEARWRERGGGEGGDCSEDGGVGGGR